MKFVPNGSIIKFLLIAVLGCGLAFLMAWLTTMFTVIKITQGVSLAGVALILLWCVVIGGPLFGASAPFVRFMWEHGANITLITQSV